LGFACTRGNDLHAPEDGAPVDASSAGDAAETSDAAVVNNGPDPIQGGSPSIEHWADLAPAPDAAPPATDAAPAIPCDWLAQTGCPVGQKCAVTASGERLCVASGTQPVGATCAPVGASDNCVAGALCVSRAGGSGICRRSCVTDGDCPSAAVASGVTPEPRNVSQCMQWDQNPFVSTCTIPCNPVLSAGPTGCAAGAFCEWLVTGGLEYTTCADHPGSQTGWGQCINNECSPGSVCVTNGLTLCTTICRFGLDVDCGTVFSCHDVDGLGAPMFGACT
jgi:hypothetical protein